MNELVSSPYLWLTFTALFLVAGAVNLARGLGSDAGKRIARFTLAVTCVVFAGSSAAFRFLSDRAGFGLAVFGGLLIVTSALLRMGQEK